MNTIGIGVRAHLLRVVRGAVANNHPSASQSRVTRRTWREKKYSKSAAMASGGSDPAGRTVPGLHSVVEEAVQPAAYHHLGAVTGIGGATKTQLHQGPAAAGRCSAALARRRDGGNRHTAAVAVAGLALCCCAAVLIRAAGSAPWGYRRAGLVSLVGADPAGQLSGRALEDVKMMYAQNPKLVKEFASLTGRTGHQLLRELVGQKKTMPAAHQRHFKGPSLATLDKYMLQLKRATEEQTHNVGATGIDGELPVAALATAEVNKRTAMMMIDDLSQDWDHSANYTQTPWEFCAGRNLSPRQIRACTGHLIRAAGVHSHRDLNMNAKIYDRFCTGDGHQYIDKYGSPIVLPPGSRAKCAKIVTARANVDTLLKRQVTMYRSHVNRVSGLVTPPKREVEGSHGINCRLIPEGC